MRALEPIETQLALLDESRPRAMAQSWQNLDEALIPSLMSGDKDITVEVCNTLVMATY